MAEQTLKNVRLYLDGIDFSGALNEVNLSYSAEMLDKTVFNSSGRRRVAGLTDVGITGKGFSNSSGIRESKAYSIISSSSSVVTILPQGTGLGNTAFFTRVQAAEYSPGGAVGQLMSYNVAAHASNRPLVRGAVLEAGALTTALTVTKTSALGARSSTQKFHAAVHLISVSSAGAKLVCKIQGCSSAGFGTPTTMARFTNLSTANVKTGLWNTTAPTTKLRVFRAKFQSTGCGAPSVNGRVVIGIR